MSAASVSTTGLAQVTDAPDPPGTDPIRIESADKFARQSGDRVSFDFDGPGAAGLNPGARFTFGDPVAPTRNPAFTVSNTDDAQQLLTVRYRGTADSDPAANVHIKFYDESGTPLVTLNENQPGSLRVDPLETVYAIVIVDTNGLTPDDDLSGTLRFHREEAAV